MKKYFYRLLPICLFILVMTGCNDTETVISIGEARNLVAEISTQSAAIGDNVTFTVKVDQQDNQLALEEDIDVVLTFAFRVSSAVGISPNASPKSCSN